MTTKLEASPTEVVRWLREMVAEKKLTKVQAERMGKRWSILGELAIQDGEWAIYVTEAGMNCDCGKGVYCPSNPQLRRKLRRIYQRGSK